MNDTDEYIREGDIALIDSKDKKDCKIYEVKIQDISPSGEYLKVSRINGHDCRWVHLNRYLETIRTSDADDSEYEDVDETAQDILAKIRNRNDSSPKASEKSVLDSSDMIRNRNDSSPKASEKSVLDSSDIIHLNEFEKFDKRNKRK